MVRKSWQPAACLAALLMLTSCSGTSPDSAASVGSEEPTTSRTPTTTTQAVETTTPAETSTTTGATAPVAPSEVATLEGLDRGLSGGSLIGVPLGEDAEAAMNALIAVLGEGFDDGWVAADTSFCRGTMVRFPIWDGLYVTLTDAATDYAAAGHPHLAFWSAFAPLDLVTAADVWPGRTTVAQLELVFGPIEPQQDELGIWTYEPPSDSPDAGLRYELSDPTEPEARVVSISAGQRDLCGD